MSTEPLPVESTPGPLKRASKFALWFALGGLIFAVFSIIGNNGELTLGAVALRTVCCTAFGLFVVAIYFASREWMANRTADPNDDAVDD
jgi:hypothetical protein